MLSLKANAALTRLREIEEKYRMKRIEQRWKRKEESDSSISSISINPSENLLPQPKDSSRDVSKPKLDIKMPDIRIEGDVESTKLLSQNKVSDGTSPKPRDVIDLKVAMPLEDKSSRSVRKQESFISDIITILENSSIESAFDNSMISSKTLSRSKTSWRQFSTSSNSRSSKRKEKTKADRKFEKEKQSDKSSDISGRELSDNSSITRRSKLSEKSNDKISKTHSDLRSKANSVEEEKVIRMSKMTNSRQNSKTSKRSGSWRDDSVIDESIGTLEDGSEIVSEFSFVEKSIANNTENRAASFPNSPKHSLAGSGYVNDTFEDISSSTMRSKSDRGESQSKKLNNENRETGDIIESSIKQIENTPRKEHGSYRNSAKGHRDEQVIECVVITRSINNRDVAIFDKEPSNYAKSFEKIDANVNNATVHSLRSLRSSSLRSGKQKRHWLEGNIPTVVNSDKNTLDSLTTSDLTEESSIDDVTKTDERLPRRKSSLEIRMTPISASEQEDGREEREKASDGTSKRAITDVIGSPVVNNAEGIELAKFSSSRGEDEETDEDEDALARHSERQISWDAENATNVLRKSHGDTTIEAVIKQHASSETMEKTSESSFGHKTEFKLRDATVTTRKIKTSRKNESHHFSEKSDCNSCEYNIKNKKRITKVRDSKLVDTRNSIGTRKEDKALRHDRKQIHRLQKRTVELRLQREREDLQKYLHELKDLRLGLGTDSTRSGYFSPLEFPKIAEFAQSDAIDLESEPDNQRIALQERVSAIRRWLKDQYILYRDYCTMAQAINAHYVPTTLEDAKKTMRELRKTGIKIR